MSLPLDAAAPWPAPVGWRDSARGILPLAWPVFIAQLAVIAFGTVDTLLVARYSALDLAALAVGSAAYITGWFIKSQNFTPELGILAGALAAGLGLLVGDHLLGLIAGAAGTTDSVAVAWLPGPPSADCTGPVVLTLPPRVGAVTGMSMEQLVPGASVTPIKENPLPPAVAVSVPPHVFATGGARGLALTRSPG